MGDECSECGNVLIKLLFWEVAGGAAADFTLGHPEETDFVLEDEWINEGGVGTVGEFIGTFGKVAGADGNSRFFVFLGFGFKILDELEECIAKAIVFGFLLF